MTTDDSSRITLPRVLGPISAWSLVVGSVIGSGIFIVPATVALKVGAIGPIVCLWVLGGAISILGALPLAELGAMLPHAGGPYVYLKAAYGNLIAFLFGWTEFLVIRAGSIATLATAFAIYASHLVAPPAFIHPRLWLAAISIAIIAVVATINVIGTGKSGAVQSIGTLLKVAALVAMILLPWFLGQARVERLAPLWPESWSPEMFSGTLAAMVGIFWTYDGWVNASELAEEIRDPGRNVPRSLVGGLIVLIVVYLGTSVSYHLVLSMGEMAQIGVAAENHGDPVAAVFFKRLLGGAGGTSIALLVMASTFIALNGNALSGPRAYFALARDGLAPGWLARVHPRFQTPAPAIIAQAVWAIVLVALTTAFLVIPPPKSTLPTWIEKPWITLHKTPLYDVLYTYVIFGGTAIYTFTMTSIFVLRRRHPEWPRPYRAWGYPWTPALYIAAMTYFLFGMLTTKLVESLIGLGIIALGIPAYALFSKHQKNHSTENLP
jgi:APA family basic amino acid/polyamine antiporter